MYDIKVLNHKCEIGEGDVGPQYFVKDLLWVVNLVYKKEDSVSCWLKSHQPRQGQRPTGRFVWFMFCFCFCFLLLLLLLFFNRFKDLT